MIGVHAQHEIRLPIQRLGNQSVPPLGEHRCRDDEGLYLFLVWRPVRRFEPRTQEIRLHIKQRLQELAFGVAVARNCQSNLQLL